MKLEKKHYVIIAVVVAIIAVWYFFLRKKTTTTSKYAGEFGSFGNESGYSARGTGNVGGTAKVKDPCANHVCPSGCTVVSVSNGKCGCKCYKQGTASGFVWA